jgi:hypothetical protein
MPKRCIDRGVSQSGIESEPIHAIEIALKRGQVQVYKGTRRRFGLFSSLVIEAHETIIEPLMSSV